MSYNSFVILPAQIQLDTVSLESTVTAHLQGRPGITTAITDQKGFKSVVVSNYGWKTFLNLNSESFVNEESKEIAEHTGADHARKAVLNNSLSRIEITTDGDPEMQHFNDHILLLQYLESSTKGVLFDCNSGELI